jgi:hypothetical protein
MATTARAARKKAEHDRQQEAAAAAATMTPERAARIEQGANLLAIGRIMAGFTDGLGSPERQYLYGFYAGIEHGLAVAAQDPAAGARWLTWMLEVIHHSDADNAAAIQLHAKRLAETAPA